MSELFVRGFMVEPGYLADGAAGANQIPTLTIQLHSVPLAEFSVAEAIDHDNDDLPLGVEQHFLMQLEGARKLGDLLVRSADALEGVIANAPTDRGGLAEDEPPRGPSELSLEVARAVVSAVTAYNPSAPNAAGINAALNRIESLRGFTGHLEADNDTVSLNAQEFFEATGALMSKMAYELARCSGQEIEEVLSFMNAQLSAWGARPSMDDD